MYTSDELAAIKAQVRKRRLTVALPCCAMLAAALAVFVIGQINRSEKMWLITVAMTLLGGGLFIFFNGVYVRPMALYRKHVDIMLNGRKRETTGYYKSFSDDISDKEGLDCHAMFINVGEKDSEVDDRLFYYDAHKSKPEIPFGTKITVVSNDKMVSEIKTV